MTNNVDGKGDHPSTGGEHADTPLLERDASRFLLANEDHHQLSRLLQQFYGKEGAAILLMIGHIMTEVGRSELLKIAEQKGIDTDDVETDRWSENRACLCRALRAGKLTLERFLSLNTKSMAEEGSQDEEARKWVDEIFDHVRHAPFPLWGTHMSILGPLLIPLVVR